MGFWENKRVMVTGGDGFLGRYVVARLEKAGASVFVPTINKFNLTEMSSIVRAYETARPAIVIHLAAVVGALDKNRRMPGVFFYNNLMMGAQLMEAARLAGVEKFVAAGTIAAYPSNAPVPFKEKDLWYGYPEEVTAPYAMAKKMLLVQSKAYRTQYGMSSIVPLLCNFYGPQDKFDPEDAHVIASTVAKCLQAVKEGTKEIVAWGTGKVTREFLYVEDAADGLLLAAEKYDSSEPVNIGSGKEITIEKLVETIAKLCGFKGAIIWDASKPDGQLRRCVDVSKAAKEFGFHAQTSLEDGLANTIAWYRQRYL